MHPIRASELGSQKGRELMKAKTVFIGCRGSGGTGLLVSCSAATSGTLDAAAGTDANPVRSYIVEAVDTDAAARAVALAGGSVISRLGVIDAVEANLTEVEHARVLNTAGIKQVTLNSIVTTQAAAANVRDNFEIGSFANNNGTHRWYGDWIEQNDDNNPHGGKVMFGWNDRGGNRLILTLNGAIYRRAATPSTAPSVTLKFKYLRAGLEPGEYVSVQASGNAGATWSELGRIWGPANDAAFLNASYDITNFRGRNTAVRFVASMNSQFGDDNVDIDDLEIAYTTTFGEGDPVPLDVNAKDVHNAGIRGRGIGVAVIDTGYWKLDSLDKDTQGNGRVAAQYDAVRNVRADAVVVRFHGHQRPRHAYHQPDRQQPQEQHQPVLRRGARCAHHFDQGIRRRRFEQLCDRHPRHRLGHQQQALHYNIRVLNLSLGAPARSRYWDDPLNKAVMRAWQSGIVVVVSAGNSGPLPQTVGVPGNVPYVITVGAMTDNYTTSKSDDRLASFSATGPTFEGFVKPDLVAPGGHVWGFMGTYQKIAVDHPTYMNSGDFFTMSGTSQAAAVVSGVAALVISTNSGLTPDQVKCRIIASGKPAVDANGKLAYSVLQQGTGLVDAKAAVYGTAEQLRQPGTQHQRRSRGHAALHGPRHAARRWHIPVTSPNSYLWEQTLTCGTRRYLWKSPEGLHLGPGLICGTTGLSSGARARPTAATFRG